MKAISLLAVVAGLNFSPAEAELNALCVDYTVDGYYPQKNAGFVPGMPGGDYIARPETISKCELEKLQNDCIGRINEYRSGLRTFKGDGRTNDVAAGPPNGDPNADTGIDPVEELTAGNVCSSRQAMGDLVVNVNGGGGCAGTHHTFGTCPKNGSSAQNSCCASGFGGDNWSPVKAMNNYANIREALFQCLQGMWDEGEEDWAGPTGHYDTMRNNKYSYVSCGFAFNKEGRAMVNQDFTDTVPTPYKATPCTCDGANAGSSSNCPANFGGARQCDPCEEPIVPKCEDKIGTIDTDWSHRLCTGDPSHGNTKFCTCQDVAQDKDNLCDARENIKQACPVTCDLCPDPGTKTCPAATCEDNIKNGNEEGVDCGGDCKACVPIDSPTPAPVTVAQCSNPKFSQLVLIIETGPKGKEAKFNVKRANKKQTKFKKVVLKRTALPRNDIVTITKCLKKNKCYQATFLYKALANKGFKKFTVTFKDEPIMTNYFKNTNKEVVKFGTCME